jgi:pimeloyl-ACP methyl ester carboxylesterase
VGGSGDNGGVGAAWVFTRSGGVWSQQGAKLVGTGAAGQTSQGSSLAVSGDGNTIVVGGPNDAAGPPGPPPTVAAGAAWVFTRSGGVWSQQGAKLVGTGVVGSGANQGYSVAVSADGNTAVVGGPWDSLYPYVGAAWVFNRSVGVWRQDAKLVGTGVFGGGAGQGFSVAVSADGNTAVVGGPGDIDSASVGATWVFTRSGGVWSQQGAKLVGAGAVDPAYQGRSVAVSGDGNTIVMGGDEDNNSVGAAWVFADTSTAIVVEALDAANPAWLDSLHHLRSDPGLLSTGGAPVVGATADGATQVLLRLAMGNTPSVTLSLRDAGNQSFLGLGTLSLPGGSSGDTSLTVTNQGGHGFAVYRSPVDFVRSDVLRDYGIHSRFVVVHCPGAQTDPQLQLVRPPVVFCHGVWSDSTTWTFPEALPEQLWRIAKVDYRETSGHHFSVNVPKVEKRIGLIRYAMHKDHFACAQVDYVGHSMGGLLGLAYTGTANYRNDDNLGQGDFHKFITLDSPYFGTQWANAVVAMRNDLISPGTSLGKVALYGNLLDMLATMLKVRLKEITAGAIDDFSVGSAALALLPAQSVPAHAHVGTGGSDIIGVASDLTAVASGLTLTSYGLFLLSLQQLGGIGVSELFGNDQHDLVVSKTSQEGGLVGPALSYSTYFSGIHNTVTGSSQVGNEVGQLLNASVSSDVFAPPHAEVARTRSSLVGRGDAHLATTDIPDRGLGIRVIAPAPGTSVHPGDDVIVRVGSVGGLEIGKVVVVAGKSGLFLSAPTLQDTLHVPQDAVGPISLDSFGVLADGSFVTGQPTVLNVVPNATILSLQLEPSTISLSNLGTVATPRVMANFSDTVKRDVTGLPGLTWTSSNTSVAVAGTDGSVVATGTGTARLTAGYAGFFASDTVVSLGGARSNTEPSAILDGPYFVRPGATICLDGSGSSDPDTLFGDHLHFAWDLDGDGHFQAGSTPILCTASSAVGDHRVVLLVTDDAGDSSVTWTTLTVSDSVSVLSVPAPAPPTPLLSLRIANPSVGALHVHYTVPARSATYLELFDIAGRRVASQPIDDVSPGEHTIELRPATGLAPGVYIVQLQQGVRRTRVRAILVR